MTVNTNGDKLIKSELYLKVLSKIYKGDDSMKVPKGKWVEIKKIIIDADNRTAKLPEDTQKTLLITFIQGFLGASANLNEDAEIISLIGRKHTGILVDDNPAYTHNYGMPIKELLPIGNELREMLKEYEGDENH